MMMVHSANYPMPRQLWIESHDTHEGDACDIIVELDNGVYYTALFVTVSYLQRQMEFSYEMGKTLPDAPPVHYAALETPHVIVPDLLRDTIEDTIDNLLALDTFESLFTQVTDEEGSEADYEAVRPIAKRATAEVAAVVVTQVLRTQGDTVA